MVRHGDEVSIPLFEMNRGWGHLNLDPTVDGAHLEHLAAIKRELFADGLRNDDPPGGVDGSAHGSASTISDGSETPSIP